MAFHHGRSPLDDGAPLRQAAARPAPVALDDVTEAQTRQRLLRAAIAVFDRKGYAAASIREIVEHAHVTKPVLYYHFGSKEGLLAAVIQEGERRFREALARAAARPGPVRDRIIALGVDLYRLFQDHRGAVRVAHAVFFGPVEAAPAIDLTAFDRALVDAVQAIVEDGIAVGDIAADPRDVAIAIAGVIGACAARQLHPGIEPVSLDSVPRILGLVLDGILRRSISGDIRP